MYRIRRATLAVLTAASLAGSAFVYCQSAAGPSSTSPTGAEAVFAPFPSHISAEPLAGGIKLRWIDSPDVAGSYAIYRSATPVTASNVDSATRLATVARGTQSYTDRPPDSKPYYYLILALAADGTPYRIVIPARNSTMAAVRAPAPEPSAASAPATVGTPVSTTPLPAIDGLKATAKGDAILLSYRPAVAGIRLVVYRGTAPITESADLLDAALIATFKDKNGSFADYPVPGLDYWYAVLGEDNLKAGHIELRQGHDVTSQPIRIAAPSSNEGTVAEGPSPRTRPLPILVLNRAPEEGAAPLPPSVLPPTRVALAPETEKAVAFLLGSEPESRPSMPVLENSIRRARQSFGRRRLRPFAHRFRQTRRQRLERRSGRTGQVPFAEPEPCGRRAGPFLSRRSAGEYRRFPRCLLRTADRPAGLPGGNQALDRLRTLQPEERLTRHSLSGCPIRAILFSSPSRKLPSDIAERVPPPCDARRICDGIHPRRPPYFHGNPASAGPIAPLC